MAVATVDTRPILTAGRNTIWDDIDVQKAEYFNAIVEYCRDRNVLADVYKSGPGIYPAWVLVEAWLDRGTKNEKRAVLKVEIRSHPFMRYPVTTAISASRGGRMKKYPECTSVSRETIVELARYVFEGGRRPSLASYRMGGVKGWEAGIVVAGFAIAFVLPVLLVGVIPYAIYLAIRHLMSTQRPDGFSLDYAPKIAFAAPILLGGLLLFFMRPQPAVVLVGTGVMAVLVGIAAATLLSRREAVVRSSGRPTEDPRLLRVIDSWGALVRGAPNAEATLKERVKAAVDAAPELGHSARLETIEYYSPAGKQSREQLVIRRNKVTIFFHCYQFGDDVYAGWDSYLNIVAWSDHRTKRGADGFLGRLVEVRQVRTVYASPTEYDLIEHNSLTAWFHERLRAELEAFATERALTLTIDFDVTKSDRSMALTAAQQQAARAKRPSPGALDLGAMTRRA